MVKFPWDTICEPTSHTTRRFNGALNLVKNWRRRFECRRVSDQPRPSRTQLKCLEVVKQNTSSRIGRTATRFLSTTKVPEGINTSMVCIVRTHRHGLTIGHCRRLERGQALPLGSRVPPSRKVAHEGRYRTRNSLHMQVLLEATRKWQPHRTASNSTSPALVFPDLQRAPGRYIGRRNPWFSALTIRAFNGRRSGNQNLLSTSCEGRIEEIGTSCESNV